MKPHITVCICTYKRPQYLPRLLEGLQNQQTEEQFTYSILVADNDRLESARPVVEQCGRTSAIPIAYCVEPEQNIALARNRAVETAKGDFIAFIDDDELPFDGWLLSLLSACRKYSADGAMGLVKPSYEQPPPAWVVKGGFNDRRTWPSGHVMNWRHGKTGNLLFKRSILNPDEPPFRKEFLTGEDQDFFRRMIQRGHVFVWSNESDLYELVPAARCKRAFMLRRALLRGRIDVLHPSFRAKSLLKSILAVPLYGLALPFLLLAGQHLFMKYLVRLCDHAGKVLAFLRLNPAGQTYVSE